MHIREPQVASAEAVSELLVVEAHQVKHSGPEIIDGADVLGGLVTKIIRGTVNMAAFDTAAG